MVEVLGGIIPELWGSISFTCSRGGGQGEAKVVEAAQLPCVVAERCAALAARRHAAAAVDTRWREGQAAAAVGTAG